MDGKELEELHDWYCDNVETVFIGDTVELANDKFIMCEYDNERILRLANKRALYEELAGLYGLETSADDDTVEVVVGSPAYYQGIAILRECEDYPIIDDALYEQMEYDEISRVVDYHNMLHDHTVTDGCLICSIYAQPIRYDMIRAIVQYYYDYAGEIYMPDKPDFTLIESELDYRARPRKLKELSEEDRASAIERYHIAPDETRWCVSLDNLA
jgi:hypothetical protein